MLCAPRFLPKNRLTSRCTCQHSPKGTTFRHKTLMHVILAPRHRDNPLNVDASIAYSIARRQHRSPEVEEWPVRDWLPLNWLCRGWCVCLWSLGLSGVLWAEEISWPRWRGTTGLGVAPNNALPEAWSPDQLKPLWQATLGTGWSSPVVDAGVVVVTDRIEARERTLAFDADSGRLRWTREHPIDFDPHAVGRRHGNGPKSTPLIDQGRVYSLGIAGWLECCELATGRSLWQVNFPAEYGQRQPLPDGRAFVDGETCVVVPVGNGQGAPVPLFGYTGSLTLWGERLIAPVGGARAGTIQAFDTRTGRVVWRALTENVSYSSPIVATLGDVPQVVVMTGPRVVGLDLVDGRLLWSHPFQIQYDESIGTPLVVGQRVIVSGDGHPATALDIERVGSS